ncbi:hypothetical protein DYB37_007098 [Aphanomyces astaci]|nr:hypothetical protein DYB37_007098 [Aphanomyces astaci]
MVSATVQFEANGNPPAPNIMFKLHHTQALVQQLHSIPKKKDMSWLWVGGGGAVLAGVLLLLVAPLRAKVMRRREYTAIPEP